VTLAGWIFLGVSWIAIGSLVAFCLQRVLRSEGGEEDPPS
jgi:hypothetical protein